MAYDLYPAVDENYDFPPEVRSALAKSPELRGTIVSMTTVERNNLLGADLWDGRIIFNEDIGKLEQYNVDPGEWTTASISDHGGLSGLDDDDHPQYLLRLGQAGVATLERALLRTDTRSTTLGYTAGKVTSVVEKDGAVTIKTTTLAYSGDQVSTVTEVAGDKTVVTTLSYDGNGNVTGTTRAVS